jgi:hypothetical protein
MGMQVRGIQKKRPPSPLRGGWPEGSGGGGDVCAIVSSKSAFVTTPIRPLTRAPSPQGGRKAPNRHTLTNPE